MAARTMKKASANTASNVKSESKVEVKAKEKEIKQFKNEDYIRCRSVTIGTLIMTGVKTKEDYNWTGYDDIEDVRYQDLQSLVTSNSDYLFYPYFVVEDEDFIEQHPRLEKFYNEQFTKTDLEEILNMDVRNMKANIEKLPKGAKETLRTLATTKVASGQIDSLSKIKALDDIFGTEINLFSNAL